MPVFLPLLPFSVCIFRAKSSGSSKLFLFFSPVVPFPLFLEALPGHV